MAYLSKICFLTKGQFWHTELRSLEQIRRVTCWGDPRLTQNTPENNLIRLSNEQLIYMIFYMIWYTERACKSVARFCWAPSKKFPLLLQHQCSPIGYRNLHTKSKQNIATLLQARSVIRHENGREWREFSEFVMRQKGGLFDVPSNEKDTLWFRIRASPPRLQ